MDNYTVTHVVKNDMGGISSLIQNLIEYRGDEALPQEVILLRIAKNTYTPNIGNFVKDVPTFFFDFNKKDNFYHSFKKLKRQIGNDKGVLVSNDTYDLLMLSHFNINKKVIQIVHDAYNVKLAIQFEAVIDVFICHSYFYYEVLCQLLSYRRDDIHFINYGIHLLNSTVKKIDKAYLNLVFIGRHSIHKGVFDLIKINDILANRNILVKWFILGNGPETGNLKEEWKNEKNVEFYLANSSEEILELCMMQDIMVFPTKFEGFPVAMVEAMSVGCVPVVSDLPGGIRELGKEGNAIICDLNNNEKFADAIVTLYNDRALYKKMSDNCIEYIFKNHNATFQSPKYQELFKKVALSQELPRHHHVNSSLGSRLDKAWIPNFVTRSIRNVLQND